MKGGVTEAEAAKFSNLMKRYALASGRDAGDELITRGFYVLRRAASKFPGHTKAAAKGAARKFWRVSNRAAVVHAAIHAKPRMTRATGREVLLDEIKRRREGAEDSRGFIRASWLGGMAALIRTGKVRGVAAMKQERRGPGVAANYGSGRTFRAGESAGVEFWSSVGSYKTKAARPAQATRSHARAAAAHGGRGLRKAMREEYAEMEGALARKLAKTAAAFKLT